MGGQGDNGNVRRSCVPFEAPRGFPAVDDWKAEVHQDNIRKMVAGVDDRVGSVLGLDDVEAAEAQVLRVQLAQLELILDNEDEWPLAMGNRFELVRARHGPHYPMSRKHGSERPPLGNTA